MSANVLKMELNKYKRKGPSSREVCTIYPTPNYLRLMFVAATLKEHWWSQLIENANFSSFYKL